jgi:hypothetical protein
VKQYISTILVLYNIGNVYQWHDKYTKIYKCIEPVEYKTQFVILFIGIMFVTPYTYVFTKAFLELQSLAECRQSTDCLMMLFSSPYFIIGLIVITMFMCAIGTFLLSLSNSLHKFYERYRIRITECPNVEHLRQFSLDYQTYVQCVSDFNDFFSVTLTLIFASAGLLIILVGYMLFVMQNNTLDVNGSSEILSLVVVAVGILLIVGVPSVRVFDQVLYIIL